MKELDLLAEGRGAALIVTLLIITTLTGLTIAFSEDSSIELPLAGYTKNGHRAHEIGRSGIHLAMALLDMDKDKEMDSLNEDWARISPENFPETMPEDLTFAVRVIDESSKLNLNSLRTADGEIDEEGAERLGRLFRILGIEEKRLNPVLDWLDADDIERLDGAENDYYESLKDFFGCANSPFITIGQIFLVKGMKEVHRFGDGKQRALLDFLTIYSDGKVNVNTASPEVLQSLDEEIDDNLAQAIIAYRSEEDFKTIEDLRKVAGVGEELFDRIKEALTVKSSFFSIEISGKSQEAVTQIKAIASREEKGPRLIYWQVS
jgi:general secretion pathway protein K